MKKLLVAASILLCGCANHGVIVDYEGRMVEYNSNALSVGKYKKLAVGDTVLLKVKDSRKGYRKVVLRFKEKEGYVKAKVISKH